MFRHCIADAHFHVVNTRAKPVNAVAELGKAQRLLVHCLVNLATRALRLNQRLAREPKIATDTPESLAEVAL